MTKIDPYTVKFVFADGTAFISRSEINGWEGIALVRQADSSEVWSNKPFVPSTVDRLGRYSMLCRRNHDETIVILDREVTPRIRHMWQVLNEAA